MAAVDFFLKLATIEGESQDHKHKNEIDVLSWSWGETNSGSMSAQGGGGSGKVAMNDFNFTMRTNKASPKLFLACANGEHIKEGLFTARKAGTDQQEYFKIKFTELLVTNLQWGGSNQGDTLPLDQISLNFAKIEVEYSAQKGDGSLEGAIKAGWNLKTNKKV